MNKILESTKFVSDNSTHVKISDVAIKELCESFSVQKQEHRIKSSPYNISKLERKDQLWFFLIFHSITYNNRWEPKRWINIWWKNLWWSMSFVYLLWEKFDKDANWRDFWYMKDLSLKEFEEFLEQWWKIALIQERLEKLHETAKTIVEKFNWSIENFLKSAKVEWNLLEFFIKNFKSFEDVSIYKNQNIYFYKLAQLVVSDRYSLLPGTEFESLIDKNSLTALADYKVPQMLRLQNILEYDNSLEEKIVKKIEIPHDSEEEIEIRANTVQAIEKIKEILIIDNPWIMSVDINDTIRLSSQNKEWPIEPHHCTRTTDY